jgi:hypothetical protein
MEERVNRLTVVILYFEIVAEGLTGVAAVLFPTVVCRLLFGAELTAAGDAMARIAGIALLSFVLACWLAQREGEERRALIALLFYNAMTTVYLAALGVQNEIVGVLLWPAIVAHVLVAALIIVALFQGRLSGGAV